MQLILNTKELAKVLHLSVGTIHQYATKAPERLPPRLKLPGRRLQWAAKDVQAWVEARRHAAVE